MAISKTKAAIAWLDDHPGASIYEAAKRHGVAYSSVYVAIHRRNRPRCQTCGQYLPENHVRLKTIPISG